MQSDECLRPTENGFELYVSPIPRGHSPLSFPPSLVDILCEWITHRLTEVEYRQAPEIQTMYSVPFPVSTIRTRMRQEFERHRYVNKLPVVDVLLLQNNAEYQVCSCLVSLRFGGRIYLPDHRSPKSGI